MPSDIVALATTVQAEASDVVSRHQTNSSFRLYRVLSKTMEICERCQSSLDDRREIEALFDEQDRGDRNRRYVEADSDIYIRVSRYVFEKEEHRSNANRYSHCLREAAKLGVRASALYDWLRQNGGLNALYMRRPLERSTVSTRCLRLTESIEVPKSGMFTLVLERTAENTFRPTLRSVLSEAAE